MPICEIHTAEMKLIPAGVSKKTGKAYEAFYACQVKDCTFRPQVEIPKANGNSVESSIIRQVAFKGAIELAARGVVPLKTVGQYTNAFEKIILKMPTITPKEVEDLADDIPFE